MHGIFNMYTTKYFIFFNNDTQTILTCHCGIVCTLVNIYIYSIRIWSTNMHIIFNMVFHCSHRVGIYVLFKLYIVYIKRRRNMFFKILLNNQICIKYSD